MNGIVRALQAVLILKITPEVTIKKCTSCDGKGCPPCSETGFLLERTQNYDGIPSTRGIRPEFGTRFRL